MADAPAAAPNTSDASDASDTSDASDAAQAPAAPRRGGFVDWLRGKLRRDGGPSLRRSLEDALEEHVEASARTDDIGGEELAMLRNLLSNGRLRLDEVMVPRADIVAFAQDDSFEDLVALFAEAAHSRLPVFRESLDDVIGMVHIKDVLQHLARPGAAPPALNVLLRSVLFVPPSMRVIDLLVKMRTARTHMAIVIDEYGGTDGLVTIEDLVEQFVGDIEDEHDPQEPEPLRRLDDGGYDADARVAVEDLAQAMGLQLLSSEREEDIDTLGGLITSLAGKVPMIGEVIDHPAGCRFEIVDGDPRRIKRVRIYPPPQQATEPAAEKPA
ncbi:MAG: HlyC/CorC family transporter [Alphaproteobacteria bacterium]|nr:MAG: HlyC/CorC family transporter [Alphaproteobacteria bacterium]